jgi:hypothetical protein
LSNLLDNKIVTGIAVALWIAVPFILWILPADYFDSGSSWCPSQRLLDIECLGCGLTRSIQHAMHLDLSTAWTFNKLFVVVFPVMIMIYVHVIGLAFGKKWFYFLRSFYRRDKKTTKE